MMCGGGWRVGHSLRQSTSGSANDVLCCLVFVKPPFLAREVGGGGWVVSEGTRSRVIQQPQLLGDARCLSTSTACCADARAGTCRL